MEQKRTSTLQQILGAIDFPTTTETRDASGALVFAPDSLTEHVLLFTDRQLSMAPDYVCTTAKPWLTQLSREGDLRSQLAASARQARKDFAHAAGGQKPAQDLQIGCWLWEEWYPQQVEAFLAGKAGL